MRFDAVTLTGKKGNKDNKKDYVAHYDPKNQLLVPGSDFETYLSKFRNATYGPKNLFTIGELSQARADDKIAKVKNTRVAKENFSTFYLPLDTL
jgi:hypothetical protein